MSACTASLDQVNGTQVSTLCSCPWITRNDDRGKASRLMMWMCIPVVVARHMRGIVDSQEVAHLVSTFPGVLLNIYALVTQPPLEESAALNRLAGRSTLSCGVEPEHSGETRCRLT
mmetsp:Transcript_2119/g.6396  ORF Transcript_2119/g.6396 Transcript_2119/m.6396 type:complete len:116 (-) Transcript_2119:180-527(-)